MEHRTDRALRVRMVAADAGASTRDLRSVAGATEAFAILPVERGFDPVRLGPRGGRVPVQDRLGAPFRPLARRYLGTHLSLARRLDALADRQEQLERR